MANHSDRSMVVHIREFPKAVFAWPLAVFSFLFFVLYHTGVNPEWLAWGQFLVLAGVFLTMALDIDIQALVIGGLVMLVVVLGSLAFGYAFSVPVWSQVGTALTNMNLQFSQQTALLWCGLGVILVLYSFCRMVYDGRWTMTPNELQHEVLFRRRRAFARGAKTVEAEYPDLLEWILGWGAGTLIVRDSRSRQEINRIPHVLGLSGKVRRLDRILELREVVDVDQDEDDASASSYVQGG